MTDTPDTPTPAANVTSITVATGKAATAHAQTKQSVVKSVRKHRLSAKEIKAIEKKYGLESDGFPLDRAGHAERVFAMAAASGTQILLGTDNLWRIYDPITGRWMDDAVTRWRFNEYVIQVGNVMYENASMLRAKLAAGAVPDDERSKIEELIRIFEAEAKSLRTSQDPVRNVAAAKSTEENKHLVEPIEFDSDKDRILTRNYVIDLPTGKRLPHGPEHKFTRWIEADYDPKAKAPTFKTFLDYTIPDPDTQAWVQRWAGYVLTGYIDEQIIAIFLGVSGSGKSSLIKAIARTLGSVARNGYARKVPEGLFRQDKSHWGDTARLINTRFAYDAEFEQDTVLNAERIRVLTGEDEIDGNEKRKAFKYFDLLAKFAISTNTMPPMSHRDPIAVRAATMRRLMIVPMNQEMKLRWSDEELSVLFATMYAERSGILAWMVAGAKEWYANGKTLTPIPAAIEAERAAYAKESGITDRIAAAIEAAGFVLDPAKVTLAADLVAAMPDPKMATALGRWLTERGVLGKQTSIDGVKGTYRFGIGKP